MPNVLSQDEVDSLLGGITEGKVETETDIPEKEEGEIEVYDFNTQSGPVHLGMPALGAINERLTGFLRTSLSATTMSVADVNISPTESINFGEFCGSLPLPTSLNIFKMEPLRGLALLVLEGPLVFSFVDILFGGKAVSHVKVEGRDFTAIEKKIIAKIVKLFLEAYQNAWADIFRLKTSFVRAEMDPQFATIVSPGDMVIVNKMSVELENATGTMTLCLPYSTIEPVKKKLKNRVQGEQSGNDHAWKKNINEKIRGLTMNLSCVLGTTEISGMELLEMKVDDVIRLDRKVSDPVILNVGGSPKFQAYPGTFNKMKAIRIGERIREE